jgi:hypothetical protein
MLQHCYTIRVVSAYKVVISVMCRSSTLHFAFGEYEVRHLSGTFPLLYKVLLVREQTGKQCWVRYSIPLQLVVCRWSSLSRSFLRECCRI